MQGRKFVLLVVLLSLVLAACSAGTSGTEEGETATPAVEQATEEPAPEGQATPADNTTPAAEEETPGTSTEAEPEEPAEEATGEETTSGPPTPGAVKEDRATVVGRVLAKGSQEPITDTYVMLAGVHREGGSGAFVLDTASSPTTTSDENGYFMFENIEPHEYVVVVGDVFHNYAILENPETQKAETIDAAAGKVLDLKEIEVEWEE